MNMSMNKRGQAGIKGIVGGFLGLIIFVQLSAQFIPEVTASFAQLSVSLPVFGSFFSTTGLAITIVAIVVFIGVIGHANKVAGGKGL